MPDQSRDLNILVLGLGVFVIAFVIVMAVSMLHM